jgi:predicted short-subunit dehydrogenase-like oxidoreductase (DUF2520 family)
MQGAFHPSSSPFSFALLGAGSVGTGVGYLLSQRGHHAAWVASRSTASAERAAELLGASPVDGERLPSGEAEVVLLGVPEKAIDEAARRIAGVVAPGNVVCHFAGVVGTEPLKAAVDAGAGACALHPVQACPDVGAAIDRLPGSAWGVTASEGMDGWAARLVEHDLAGTPVAVAEGDRALWHAAAVTVSNGLAALWDVGASILEAIGEPSPERVLGPLAAGTLANTRAASMGAALTGPVVRGERATLCRHLEALERRSPEDVGSYALAARLIASSARRTGRLDPEFGKLLEDLLDGR